MPEIIGVKFKDSGKAYYFDPDGITVKKGERVIVETSQGLECGLCTIGNSEISEEFELPLKKLIRVAAKEDLDHLEENRKKEKEAFSICSKKIAAHGLEMKLISVENTCDNSKKNNTAGADDQIITKPFPAPGSRKKQPADKR